MFLLLVQKKTSWITLPKGKGLKLSNLDDRKRRLKTIKENRKSKKTVKRVSKTVNEEKKAPVKTEKKKVPKKETPKKVTKKE